MLLVESNVTVKRRPDGVGTDYEADTRSGIGVVVASCVGDCVMMMLELDVK